MACGSDARLTASPHRHQFIESVESLHSQNVLFVIHFAATIPLPEMHNIRKFFISLSLR